MIILEVRQMAVKKSRTFNFFTPYNAYKSIITFELPLKYEWIVLADFSLFFYFRKFGGTFFETQFAVTSSYVLPLMSARWPADSPGCGNNFCASVGTLPASLRPSQMSGSGWAVIN